MDEFWDIQLGTGNHEDSKYSIPSETNWMAPTEREKILGRIEGVAVTDMEDRYVYEWTYLYLPLGSLSSKNASTTTSTDENDIKLHLRTIRSNVALLESHVGEELWDAAKIFCAHLCLSRYHHRHHYGLDLGDLHSSASEDASMAIASTRRLRGKKVLELGAGVASLGMCIAALGGATEVLCTDYDEDVLSNLRFNLQHNAPNLHTRAKSGMSSTTTTTTCTTMLKWAKLDWKMLAADDYHVEKDEGTSSVHDPDQESDAVDTMKYNGDVYAYNPDIVIGSALVYSAEGAMYCADAINYFLTKRGAEEAWVLQMPERPGFDRFLMRLERLGLTHDAYEIDEKVFQLVEGMIQADAYTNAGTSAAETAAVAAGAGAGAGAGNKNVIASDIDDFRLMIIQRGTREERNILD